MRWFRSNAKWGVRLALFALAAQFALTFGHTHSGALHLGASPFAKSVQAACSFAESTSQAADARECSQALRALGDIDNHATDVCAICAAMAMAASPQSYPVLALLDAPPPSIALDRSAFATPEIHRAVQQPRAPPVA